MRPCMQPETSACGSAEWLRFIQASSSPVSVCASKVKCRSSRAWKVRGMFGSGRYHPVRDQFLSTVRVYVAAHRCSILRARTRTRLGCRSLVPEQTWYVLCRLQIVSRSLVAARRHQESPAKCEMRSWNNENYGEGGLGEKGSRCIQLLGQLEHESGKAAQLSIPNSPFLVCVE